MSDTTKTFLELAKEHDAWFKHYAAYYQAYSQFANMLARRKKLEPEFMEMLQEINIASLESSQKLNQEYPS